MTLGLKKKENREWAVFENEGEKLFGVVHHPLQSRPPIVICMHGFASHKVGTNRSYVSLAEKLCEAGIATLRFDFRGCGDSEGHLASMTLDNFVSDAVAAYEYIRGLGYHKIGFFGSSFGGAISVMAANRLQTIQSLALWAPVASGELWFNDFMSKHPNMEKNALNHALKTYRGVPLHPLFKEQFGQMNAAKELQSLTLPVIHFQGEKDEVISISHQRAFQKARAQTQTLSRFITYPETDHWLGYATVLPQILNEITQWFKETLNSPFEET